MLLELRVENLVIIERAELRLGPGLNAITGETGAGKTVLAQALDLLLGGKPRAGIVRPGAEEAYVEGVFEMPPGLLDAPALGELRERVPADGSELVLGRRVGASGRTSAFVQGRSATAADLRELGGRLVSFYGQHEHRRLTLAKAQLQALDAFCGDSHLELRRRYGAAHAQAAARRAEVEELSGRAGERERNLDLLVYELEEIEALDPSEGEEAALEAERARLRSVDALRTAAGAGAEALAPEAAEARGAAELLAEAEQAAAGAAGVDASLDALASRLGAVRIEAQELAADLRRYLDGLEGEPGRLEQVEERLEGYERLKRKHGGTVAAVLEHAKRCRAERERLENADEALEGARARLADAEADERRLAAELAKGRRHGAPKLAERVRSGLAELAMDGASFEVSVEPRDGLGANGGDRVEFLIAPNPGVPAAPLREIASGGELSRVMLALMGAAGPAQGATLVFDEVDAGIGGQTARTVGERLRALGDGGQVLCITHLPQIASLARRHFTIEKSADDELATASVVRVEDDAVVAELCRMLGADSTDDGARRHAESLLAA